MKEKTIKIILIIIIVLLVLLIVSVAVFYKMNNKENTNKVIKEELNDFTSIEGINEFKESKDLDENSMAYGVSQIFEESETRKIKLPMLVGSTEGIEQINQKINVIYTNIQNITDKCIEIDFNTTVSKYKGHNILDINITVSKYDNWEYDAGYGLYSYHYNMDSGTEFTFQDIIANENYSLEDIQLIFKEDLAKKAELWGGKDKVVGCWDYAITGNEMYVVEENEGINTLKIVLEEDKGYIKENGKPYCVICDYKEIKDYSTTK